MAAFLGPIVLPVVFRHLYKRSSRGYKADWHAFTVIGFADLVDDVEPVFQSSYPCDHLPDFTPLQKPVRRRRTGVEANPTDRVAACQPGSTVELLASHGVIERVRKYVPSALRYDVSRVKALFDALNVANINARKVINALPRVLHTKPETLSANTEFLQKLIVEMPRAVERCPELLYLPIGTIESKLNMLQSFGVRPDVVLRRYPTLVHRSEETIRARMAVLSQLGLDARWIVERLPQTLGCAEQSLRDHVAFLRDVGLDAVRIINAQPQVLWLKIEGNLRPKVSFITQDMGRPLEDINWTPACLTYSLEKRIKPRFRYFLAHGQHEDCGLGTLLLHNDETFVWNVARQSLGHYRAWLKSQHL